MPNIRLEDMCSVNAAKKIISINQSINILIKFKLRGKFKTTTLALYTKTIVISSFKSINSLYRWNVLAAIYQKLSVIPFTEFYKIFFSHFKVFEV